MFLERGEDVDPGSQAQETADWPDTHTKGKFEMTNNDVLIREQVLALLSKKAREGSVSAAIALERALRIDPHTQDTGIEDELDRLLGDREGS